jgi:hypothetical protein
MLFDNPNSHMTKKKNIDDYISKVGCDLTLVINYVVKT